VAKTPSARSDNLIFAYGEVPRALGLALRTTRPRARRAIPALPRPNTSDSADRGSYYRR
jgi:hypothetical protein